jgi:hypothetical protein
MPRHVAISTGAEDRTRGTLLVQRIFSGPSAADCGGPGTLQCGDLNGNGSLTVADLTVELNLIAGNAVVFNCTAPGMPESNATLAGSIFSNRTFSGAPGSNVHAVNGTVYVNPGVVLTFQPGAIVKGVKGAVTPSALVFRRGSKINAAGTPANPIIFTSDQPHGSRGIGDWGGIWLNGNAPANCPPGTCLAEGPTGVEFGGDDPNDSSGVIQYARIEFASGQFYPEPSPAFVLNGVGRGTVIDHVQVNHTFDDGFALFGGTVNLKHVVASSIGDDAFDWTSATPGTSSSGSSSWTPSTPTRTAITPSKATTPRTTSPSCRARTRSSAT